MPDLSEVIGSLMVSLVHARRMADEETAAVAEYYQNNPLLEGLSLPRVRVPRLEIEMPVLIEGQSGTQSAVMKKYTAIEKALKAELSRLEKAYPVSSTFSASLRANLKSAYDSLQAEVNKGAVKLSQELAVRKINQALLKSSRGKEIAPISASRTAKNNRAVVTGVAYKIVEIGVSEGARIASVTTTTQTSSVKEQGTPDSSVNLKIIMIEEGLEWTRYEDDEGNIQQQLQPE